VQCCKSQSGCTLLVLTIEWSMAKKTAKPTSALEGYMWEKEMQVECLRERVLLAQLLMNTKVTTQDPTLPKPRDWIRLVRRADVNGKFVIIPVRFVRLLHANCVWSTSSGDL
jgi:hypothetical protein